MILTPSSPARRLKKSSVWRKKPAFGRYNKVWHFRLQVETTMNQEQKVELILVDLGLTAPRITPAMIDELMREVTYSTHLISGTTTTVATAIDGAGFTICSVASASASPENFNPALGIEIAITKARDAARAKLWELEGYRLKRALHDARSEKSTASLEQIRAILAKPRQAEPVPLERHWVGQAGVQPSGPHDHSAYLAATALSVPDSAGVATWAPMDKQGQPQPCPLAKRVQALAISLSDTAQHMQKGTAWLRDVIRAQGALDGADRAGRIGSSQCEVQRAPIASR